MTVAEKTDLQVQATASKSRLRVLAPDPGSVDGAVVRPVGVEDSGEMEIPEPEEVGWYEFGTTPGRSGSAVLAAHIAADGIDGVFRYLTEAGEGDRVEVVSEEAAS